MLRQGRGDSKKQEIEDCRQRQTSRVPPRK